MAAKKIISDMVLPQKKEITAQLFREPPPTIKHPSPQKNRRWGRRAVFIAAALLLVFFASSVLGAKMQVSIAPKRSVIDADQTITLSQNPAGEEELKLKKFSVVLAKKMVFPATDKTAETAKAEGIIAVFNKGKDAQVLIAPTRFESPDGKIYRIPAGIVVPASKTDNGKIIPGSKETKVIAEKAGPEYNIGLSDFTLPALKGSPKFNLIFGRSKTEMKGGSSGERIVVGKEDKSAALAKLAGEAKTEAGALAKSKLPQNEFLVAPTVEYVLSKETVSPEVGQTAKEFEIALEGEVKGISVGRAELESFLIKKYPQLNGDTRNLKIKNLDALSVKISGYKFDLPAFKMQISGKTEVEGSVDIDAIRDGVAERKLFNPSDILSAYPGLSRAEVKYKPFWSVLFKSYTFSRPDAIDIILEER